MNGGAMTEDPVDPDRIGERVLTEATKLAIPRYPGTEGDRKAIEFLEDRFRQAGLEAERQHFSYDISWAESVLRVVLVIGGLLVAAAGAVTSRSPGLGFAIVVAAIIPGLVLLAWSPWLERLYRRDGKTETANVWGRRRAVGAPTASLILMAHHDSKSQSLTFPFRMGLTVLAICGMLMLLVAVMSGLIRWLPTFPAWIPLAGGLAAAIAMLILSTMKSGNRSPGGVDNAGSVAIVLELARSFPPVVPDGVELIFLSTGAEEDHMVGAMRWLDAHADEFTGRPVFCLNFDGAGAPGRTVLIERYGFGRMFSPAMSDAARRAATRLKIQVRGIVMLPAMGIDAIPFAHRGIPCLTLSSGSLGKATMSVHSANDRAEHLDAETLARIKALATETLLELVAQFTPRTP